jgi:hypothetical protein
MSAAPGFQERYASSQFGVLKGHDFSRAAGYREMGWALAPEGMSA